jgi:hypothetical protein
MSLWITSHNHEIICESLVYPSTYLVACSRSLKSRTLDPQISNSSSSG